MVFAEGREKTGDKGLDLIIGAFGVFCKAQDSDKRCVHIIDYGRKITGDSNKYIAARRAF